MELINKALLVGKDGLFSKRGCPGNCQYCGLWSKEGCRVILEAPTADAVEVVHGHWKRTSMYDEESSVQCSACLMEFDYIDGMCYLVTGSELPFYCANCGAHMDGGTKCG